MNWNDIKAATSITLLLLSSTSQFALAQQQTQQAPPTQNQPNGGSQTNPTAPATPQPIQNDTTRDPNLPQAPDPKLTEPLFLRDTDKDYTHLKNHGIHGFRSLFAPYTATEVPLPRLGNSAGFSDLLRDGKIYLSLNDAVTLALENNYDIAIARINLDIADTDILRTKAGATFRGVSTGLVTNTLGGTTSTITGGGGPGGTSSASGGAGTGASGLVLSTNGGGPLPYNYDPVITGNLQYENLTTQESSTLFTGTNQLKTTTETYNFGYLQGFSTGSQLAVTYDNTRQTTSSPRSSFSPLLQPTIKLQFTQHLLQGFGPSINKRFIVEATNNRRITDSAFRQQVIYTVTQVESIYWSLVSAYEDEQAKERALNQSTALASDNRKQLQIGTLAPLDVVNSDSAVATDKQALITSQSNLEYQQLLIKQAIARNLNDPQLASAPVVPTDRVGLDRLPEEDMKVEDVVKEAFINNPQIEQAALELKNNQITIRGEKNGLLPIIDAYGSYGSTTIGGQQNSLLKCSDPITFAAEPCNSTNGGVNNTGYFNTLGNGFNGTAPDYIAGLNIQIPLRNRVAQADQARSQMELRQTEMRIQQLYTQIRIQVINAQYAITNDRANVVAAQTARDFNAQSLDAEQKKYKLGASTTALVLAQERTLAIGENNLIAATAAYAKDRSALAQILSNTLDRYNISLTDAATGTVTQKPNIPGLTPPVAPAPPKPLSATPPPLAN
ncbi:TolC family protein [Granulicella tundricola]|uniref:Outer membrane efflux protein n=1 Tax=Granulicella tundricola (strain ATCC BAA-1859 / DSM 23138 / MP5ACTX9) TaxID=1198114 RepID=E8WYA7_GRATM|nr:TolC family protein [Granulicella tundricola]ADW68734.1 outer membrane efflux protein [Granulicella tundricola MP5ACTX9]